MKLPFDQPPMTMKGKIIMDMKKWFPSLFAPGQEQKITFAPVTMNCFSGSRLIRALLAYYKKRARKKGLNLQKRVNIGNRARFNDDERKEKMTTNLKTTTFVPCSNCGQTIRVDFPPRSVEFCHYCQCLEEEKVKMSNNALHAKDWDSQNSKKIDNQRTQLANLESKNKELREKNLEQVGMLTRLAFDILELEKKLVAAELLNTSQGQYVIELHKEMDNFQKRFLSCWDEKQEEKRMVALHKVLISKWEKMAGDFREKWVAAEIAGKMVDELLKTKTSACDQLRRTITAMDQRLNVLEKEKEIMG